VRSTLGIAGRTHKAETTPIRRVGTLIDYLFITERLGMPRFSNRIPSSNGCSKAERLRTWRPEVTAAATLADTEFPSRGFSDGRRAL
jgi:hypothetical protein